MTPSDAIISPQSRVQELADRELIDRMLRGDGQAAEEFCRMHRYLVASVLRRFRNLSLETREDLFQEVFLRLFEHECRMLAAWRGNSNFAGYLRRIVRNIAIDRLRALNRIPPTESIEEDDEALSDPDASTDPSQLSELNEMRRRMLMAIQRLPPPDMEIVTLICVEELSYQQAADRLGITRNLVGVRLHEGKKRLRKIVEEFHPELSSHW